MDIFVLIEKLLQYSKQQYLIEEIDIIEIRNSLYDLLQLTPTEAPCPVTDYDNIYVLLDHISDYAFSIKLFPENTITYRDMFQARIMGLIMPRQSEINRTFYENYRYSPKKATSAFYQLNIASNYIQTNRISKNLYWTSQTQFGN